MRPAEARDIGDAPDGRPVPVVWPRPAHVGNEKHLAGLWTITVSGPPVWRSSSPPRGRSLQSEGQVRRKVAADGNCSRPADLGRVIGGTDQPDDAVALGSEQPRQPQRDLSVGTCNRHVHGAASCAIAAGCPGRRTPFSFTRPGFEATSGSGTEEVVGCGPERVGVRQVRVGRGHLVDELGRGGAAFQRCLEIGEVAPAFTDLAAGSTQGSPRCRRQPPGRRGLGLPIRYLFGLAGPPDRCPGT